MKKIIVGNKVGMTQLIDKDGIVTPVTAVKVSYCSVIKLIDMEKQGYNAVLVGYDEKNENKCNKAEKGFFDKLKVSPVKYLTEARLDDLSGYAQKKEITVDTFEKNELVSVRSKSMGRGFAGTVKRHNFSCGPKTHGSKNYRRPGSIGGGTDPGRVFKGKKMPGRYGNEYVTIKNLQVLDIDNENRTIYLKGAVPGKRNTVVEIYKK
ncbi:MAG: 50S ribosomal protein L3 [bacterium]|nr:50S ribosomal protein L3 [bacterium]